MKNKEPLFFLEDIANSLDKIFKYTDNINFQEFMSSDIVRDAVERNFEIIGEAVKNLSNDFRNQYPHIPFKQVAGMRDKLIHDYFGVDYEIIWQTIIAKLPEFSKEIKKLISIYK
ncbi:DUF86 domain-containing protein [bacterium]|nr:DUF86 domain-containing protein [bacterium]